jgi:RHS repeat-associated protein
MTRTHRFFALAVLLALTACVASAQVQTGTPPFGSFGGGPDVINLANLNSHITIPVFHKPGRGTNFTYDLSYDSSVWFPSSASGTNTWTPITNWGWGTFSQATAGLVTYTVTPKTCTDRISYYGNYNEYSNWTFIDSLGTAHRTYIRVSDESVAAPPCTSPRPLPYSIGPITLTDGSGYTLSVTADPAATLSTASGTTLYPNLNYSSTGTSTDRNGNQISVSGVVFTDTLGTTALTVAGSGTPSSPITFTYTPPNISSSRCASTNTAGVACYTMNYTNYTIATNFGVSGIGEYKSSAAVPLVTSIVLPDNSQYTFTYEATPGTCTPYSGTTCVTARLSSVMLPTGGTITYSYSGGNNGIYTDGSAATLNRTTPDGTWTYARTQVSGNHWQTKVTTPPDPQNQGSVGDDTLIDFQKDSNTTTPTSNFYETQRVAYQGSSSSGTLLRTTTICYNTNTASCTTTAVSSPITQRTVVDQYGSSGLQCKHNYLYNGVGGLTEQDDYDYGSGAPGALLRRITTTYASLGNITAFRQTVTVYNGAGTQVAQTNYNYDENTAAATSGIAQHTSVTGSRGNLTSVNYPVSGLTAHFTYYDTGSLNTSQDVNGASTTYNYSSTNNAYCQMAFPTSISEPLSLSKSMTWNCTGGVQLTAVDENNQTTTTNFNDPYFWRPASVTDLSGNITSFCYGLISSGTCTVNATQVESTLNFNSSNSTVDKLTTLDGLGRAHVQQTRQSPTATTFDSVETDYDALGRVSRVTLPYSAGAGQTNSSAPATATTYDALYRILSVSDSGNGSASYTYTQNDAYLSLGPAPSGENAKRRQLEYDSLGRLTSVCEITGASGSGNCGQTSAQTGYWTKYVYDPLGNLTGVTQNAQSTGSQQTRSYSFDAMSRLTSETNPENGATTYTFDSATGCTGTSSGDLVKRADAQGNTTCFAYDALHRMTSATYSGPYAGNTPTKNFVYDSATVNGQAMQNAKARLAEAYTGPSTGKITDLGLSYTARGEVSDAYQSTPHSSGYYHLTESYWAHGVPSQLSGNIGLPTISYGVDGEGRPTTTSANSGPNPVTSTSYNLYSSPPQLQVTFGSGDSDTFSYDANTGRMTQYKFTVGNSPQSLTGNLTWNANGSLGQHAITDPFNGANTQTCNYQHDDVSRIAQVDCGSGAWGQSFAYDPFGNITKNVLSGHTGNSFQPTYSSATNKMTALPGFTPTYDSNGNVLNDASHQYTPDAEGRPVTLDTVSLTFDALNRMVEQQTGSSYTQIAYTPTGEKLALMNGQTLQKAFVPLPGGAEAVYTSSGLDHYRHTDWLGSVRLTSTTSRTVSGDTAYAPFGETYAQSGTPDISFTGQNADTSSSLYDFLFREYSNQGRWPAPDPAGLGAVDPSNPQSWNRYSYVLNGPLNLIDPLGLDCVDVVNPDNSISTTCTVNGDDGGDLIPPGGCLDVTLDGFSMGNTCAGGDGSIFRKRRWRWHRGGNTSGSWFSQTKTGCFLKGAAVGAATAVGVGLVAAGAVALGVVSAPVASGALLVAGAVGGTVALYNGYTQASNGNWAGAAYSAGTIAGGVAGGSVVGATVGDAINPPATRGFWSIGRDVKNFFNPRLGSVGKWLGTGPDAAAAAGATGLAGAGAATAAKGGC